jgi:hypothetical protein
MSHSDVSTIIKTHTMTNDITPEQIAEWKAKHGDVWKITVEDKVAYLRSPDRKTLGYASGVGASDPMKYKPMTVCFYLPVAN